MARFFINQTLDIGSNLLLPINIVKHAQALRINLNDDIELFNGNSKSYIAHVTTYTKNKIIVTITQILPSINTHQLTIDIAVSVVASDKMDIIIQKATELGVNKIIPVISKRTQKKDNNTLDKKIARWQNIVINSCEQCGLNTLPPIESITKFDDLLDNYSKYSAKIILSPKPNNNIKLPQVNKNIQSILLLVGPEGGFTENEINKAITYKFTPITLGSLTMRTETAVIAGIVAMYSKYSDWIL